MGEVKVVVQCGSGPDLPGLDTPVIEGWPRKEVRFLSILEMDSNVLEKVGLVAFDGEVVVRLPVFDQIGGEFALGQQCIGGDILALYIDGIQQRNGHLDLVGAFDLVIAVYRQGSNFFWV